MKSFIVLACFVATTFAQRSPYAGGSPKGVPELHPRFRPTNDDGTQDVVPTNLGNRIADIDNTNIPLDARGDVDLVNRMNTWPKENIPFWLTNYKIIEEHRGRPGGVLPNADSNNPNVFNSRQPTVNNGGGSNQGSGLSRPSNTGFSQNGNSNEGTGFSRPTNNGVSSNGGSNQPLNNRFGGNNSNNSFSIVMNGEWRRYVYDELTDTWIRGN